MAELSVFIDESGNSRKDSKYYLLTLVFHKQDEDIGSSISAYEASLGERGFADIPFHINPLLRGNDGYANVDVRDRVRLLSCFRAFANKLPFKYHTFSYEKRLYENDAELFGKIRRDLVLFLFDNLDTIQPYETVKIYYDNGQEEVTRVIHSAFEYALDRQGIVYRKCPPTRYRLQQVADYACGIELANLKYERLTSGATEALFFGTWREFKKNFLKKLRQHAV